MSLLNLAGWTTKDFSDDRGPGTLISFPNGYEVSVIQSAPGKHARYGSVEGGTYEAMVWHPAHVSDVNRNYSWIPLEELLSILLEVAEL